MSYETKLFLLENGRVATLFNSAKKIMKEIPSEFDELMYSNEQHQIRHNNQFGISFQ